MLSKSCGFDGKHIMFSSNETPAEEFVYADKLGAIINLDDFTHVQFWRIPLDIFQRPSAAVTIQVACLP